MVSAGREQRVGDLLACRQLRPGGAEARRPRGVAALRRQAIRPIAAATVRPGAAAAKTLAQLSPVEAAL